MGRGMYYAARAAGRAAVRARNQYIRSAEANERREQKICYQNSMIDEASEQTQKCLDTKNSIHMQLNRLKKNKISFSIDIFKQKYEKSDFKFRNRPNFIDKAKDIVVPNETWMENIIKAKKEKRILIEENKKNQMLKDKEEYEKLLNNYEKEKSEAYQKYEIEEQKKKKEIEKFNSDLDAVNELYLNNDEEAIDFIINNFISYIYYNVFEEISLKPEYKYNISKKQLIINSSLNSIDSILICQEYKYVKSRDEIESVPFNQTTEKSEALFMAIRTSFYYIENIFSNLNSNVKEIIFNMYYNDICISSVKLDEDSYKKLELKDYSDIEEFLSDNIRSTKSINTGIKEFEFVEEKPKKTKPLKQTIPNIKITVVGINYDNRQTYWKKLNENDQVYLKREPNNEYDTNAIRVEDKENNLLGYVSSDLAIFLAPILDGGSNYTVRIITKQQNIVNCEGQL